eukprot:COSAG02_NODE_1734_length_11163_cov_43.814262_5_plen_66_part_00
MPELLQVYSTVLFFMCHVGFQDGRHSLLPAQGIGGGGGGGGGGSGGIGGGGGQVVGAGEDVQALG